MEFGWLLNAGGELLVGLATWLGRQGAATLAIAIAGVALLWGGVHWLARGGGRGSRGGGLRGPPRRRGKERSHRGSGAAGQGQGAAAPARQRECGRQHRAERQR